MSRGLSTLTAVQTGGLVAIPEQGVFVVFAELGTGDNLTNVVCLPSSIRTRGLSSVPGGRRRSARKKKEGRNASDSRDSTCSQRCGLLLQYLTPGNERREETVDGHTAVCHSNHTAGK